MPDEPESTRGKELLAMLKTLPEEQRTEIENVMSAMVRVADELGPEERRRLAEYKLRFRRFIVGGSAGGLVLAITMSTALVGQASDSSVPWPLALAATFFLIALILGAVISYQEREEIQYEHLKELTDSVRKKLAKSESKISDEMRKALAESQIPGSERDKWLKRLEVAMIVFLSLGAGTSFIVLWHLTEFP